MIVKNEQEVLARCLDSVREAVDELVIVDTGSTDKTKEIAARYADKLLDFPWCDDFSAARNFAFSHGSGDYLMWLDADDVVTPQAVTGLCQLKEELAAQPDVVMLPYQLAFDQEGHCISWCYRERLIKRAANLRWQGRVHEVITPSGVVWKREIPIEHHSLPEPPDGRNRRIYEQMLADGYTFTARDHYYYGRELFEAQQWSQAAAQWQQFLSFPDGWIEDRLAAAMMLSSCYEELDNWKTAECVLLEALSYTVPRASLCCVLGKHYANKGYWQWAAFWYQCALTSPRTQDGFVSEDDYDYRPLIELCVCYDHLGQYEKAAQYNEQALKVKPNDPSALANAQYFAKRLQDQ